MLLSKQYHCPGGNQESITVFPNSSHTQTGGQVCAGRTTLPAAQCTLTECYRTEPTAAAQGCLSYTVLSTRIQKQLGAPCLEGLFAWWARLPTYWHGGFVGVFSLTAGTLICSLGCWLGLSELAGTCAGLGPPGFWSGAEAVVTTCCCMSFCCTTWAVAVTVGIICTCCPAAVACVSVTVCGEAWGRGRTHMSPEHSPGQPAAMNVRSVSHTQQAYGF
jgi:hypothetical protein